MIKKANTGLDTMTLAWVQSNVPKAYMYMTGALTPHTCGPSSPTSIASSKCPSTPSEYHLALASNGSRRSYNIDQLNCGDDVRFGVDVAARRK